jgi:hypothetical protein
MLLQGFLPTALATAYPASLFYTFPSNTRLTLHCIPNPTLPISSTEDANSPLPIANFNTLLNMEIDQQMGAMAVTVCGGGSLSDDVRAAVRGVQDKGNVDFIEEAFSW